MVKVINQDSIQMSNTEIIMKIGSVTENKDTEKRISITPEISKKYIK